jgi:hypothetical protein
MAENKYDEIAVIALYGEAGAGKSSLAKVLCRDESVRAAFPDGVIWTAAASTENDLISEMHEIGIALGDEQLSGCNARRSCHNRYLSALRDKAALLVIDDARTQAAVEPFLAYSPGSRLLITTRDAGLAQSCESQLKLEPIRRRWRFPVTATVVLATVPAAWLWEQLSPVYQADDSALIAREMAAYHQWSRLGWVLTEWHSLAASLMPCTSLRDNRCTGRIRLEFSSSGCWRPSLLSSGNGAATRCSRAG